VIIEKSLNSLVWASDLWVVHLWSPFSWDTVSEVWWY